MLLRNEPNPGREVTSRSEGPGVSNTRDQSGCQHRTDPGNVMKALARLVGPVPGHDHPIKLQDLPLEAEQLIAKRGKARTANRRHPFVAWVGNNMQQFRDSFAPYRRDNAELGKVSSDRINHRGLLADEQVACAVKHQTALLLRCLGWHKPHVGPGDCFANRLCVKRGEIGGVIEPRSTLAKPPFFPEIGTTSVSQLGYILFCLKTETLKPRRVQDEGAAST